MEVPMKRLIADIRWIEENRLQTVYVAVVNNDDEFQKAMDDDDIFYVFYPDEVEPHVDVDFEFIEFREDGMQLEDLPTFTNNDPFEALNFLEVLLENCDQTDARISDEVNTAVAWIREALESSYTGYEDKTDYSRQAALFGDSDDQK
jgi:hypothetical protein